jgi:hypothetical protein
VTRSRYDGDVRSAPQRGRGESALLIVRVWYEEEGFRARVTTTTGVEHGAVTRAVTATTDELQYIVDAWLSEVTGS